MITKLLMVCLISLSTHALDTTTEVTFTSEKSAGEDKSGNALYDRDVKINTKNFKVENFWNKFSYQGEGVKESEFETISQMGTVRISVESTSICSLYSQLDKNGCSGQKPFLINDEALIAKSEGDVIKLVFQKDYNGSAPFDADGIPYSDLNDSVFYPLDVDRNGKYYKEQAHSKNSFFGIFRMMFNAFFGQDGFFSAFFNFGVTDTNNQQVEDVRKRYIANIISGLDQDHLLTKGETPIKTTLLNSPVSLIDYTEDVSVDASCNMFMFTFSESSLICNMMGAMSFIMPFANENPAVNYTVDTIQADTENSLITFASSYSGMTLSEYNAGTVYVKESSSSTIMGAIVKSFSCMIFGCPKVEDIEQPTNSYYAFDDDSAINLTMAVTEGGTSVDDFQTFRLKSINSIAANQHTCHVDYDPSGWSKDWDYNFKGGQSDVKTVDGDCIENCGYMDGKNIYEQLEVPNLYGEGDDAKTPSQWLTWCDNLMQDYTGGTHTECTSFMMIEKCREVPNTVEDGDYEILSNSYVNSAKRGLILELELINLTPTSKAATLRYELISTKH